MTRIHTAEPYIIDLELGTIDIQVYGKRKYKVYPSKADSNMEASWNGGSCIVKR